MNRQTFYSLILLISAASFNTHGMLYLDPKNQHIADDLYNAVNLYDTGEDINALPELLNKYHDENNILGQHINPLTLISKKAVNGRIRIMRYHIGHTALSKGDFVLFEAFKKHICPDYNGEDYALLKKVEDGRGISLFTLWVDLTKDAIEARNVERTKALLAHMAPADIERKTIACTTCDNRETKISLWDFCQKELAAASKSSIPHNIVKHQEPLSQIASIMLRKVQKNDLTPPTTRKYVPTRPSSLMTRKRPASPLKISSGSMDKISESPENKENGLTTIDSQ